MRIGLLFASTIALCASASVLKLQSAARLFGGNDLLGKYELFVKQGKCPQTIEHLNFTEVPLEVEGKFYSAYAIQHSEIEHEGEGCESVGQFAIVPNSVIDAAGYREALGEAAPVVDDLHEQEAEFLVGVELVKRQCGNTYFSKSALAIFVKQEKKVRVPGLISLYPGAKYIVVYEKDSPTPCTYFQSIPGRTIGQPIGGSAEDDDVLTPEDLVVEDNSPTATNSQTSGISSVTSKSDAPPLDGVPLPVDQTQNSSSPLSTTTAPNGEDEIIPGESPSPNAGGSACFPASAEVTLENGAIKRMDEIEIGDKVLTENGIYSEVFMFTHRDKRTTSEFVEIQIESGRKLELTEGHYLYVGKQLKSAESVRIDDMLSLSNGTTEKVQRIRKVLNVGLYNPQTSHGNIAVNGVVTSTYTKSIHPRTAHSLLSPLRLFFRALRLSTYIFENGAENIVEYFPKGGDLV